MNSPSNPQPPTVAGVLLRRRALVFVTPGAHEQPAAVMEALDLELAALGFVASTRLRSALARLDDDALAQAQRTLCGTIAAQLGADLVHEPLFRKFPHDIPDDTHALWWTKVTVHFVQAPEQPCIFCRRVGTTHVLRPCQHVVCDHCFDGSNYSACPICERHVDRSSPFFAPTPAQAAPTTAERVQFKLLDLGTDIDDDARQAFAALTARVQALSPVDREDLETIVRTYRERVLPWLADKIPVRENVAVVFGTLFQTCDPLAVMPVARKYLRTATDVLRLVAVYSGANASLQGEIIVRYVDRQAPPEPWWSAVARMFGRQAGPAVVRLPITVKVKRFKVAKLRRPLRRALLAILDQLDPDALAEDMLRHRSYWVGLGEFLHPHEYADRYPNAARGFAIVRRKAPDGTPAPGFRGWYSRVEAAAAAHDAGAMVTVLRERPGEFARRLDHVLRIAGHRHQPAIEAFVGVVERVATPVLVSLAAGLPTRTERAPVRVYFPKGGTVTGVSAPDLRPPLAPAAIAETVAAVERELLRRFAAKPGFEHAIVDEALRATMVPFNERTASPAAVNLPRGSIIDVPDDKFARMFVHWCEPERGGHETDLDLSVGFYDADWKPVGVCSYYQLKFTDPEGNIVAQSSGDLRDAPFPDGASEFVDLDLARARAQGMRFAVMVVNAYAGMTFSTLERCFAGLMLRNSADGLHFDPRTVELKFALQGEHGVFMPLVYDLATNRIHWTDAYSRGALEFNNVATSNKAITKICPELIAYFGSGVRMSMFELALLHAAARSPRVYLRSTTTTVVERAAGEDPVQFLARLRQHDHARAPLPHDGAPALALLYRGDLELPPGSSAYALFPGRTAAALAAADLLA